MYRATDKVECHAYVHFCKWDTKVLQFKYKFGCFHKVTHAKLYCLILALFIKQGQSSKSKFPTLQKSIFSNNGLELGHTDLKKKFNRTLHPFH